MSIKYSDGQKIELTLRTLLEGTNLLGSREFIGEDQYRNWAFRYHLSPERGNLVRHLNFAGLDVVELGGGMAGVSRVLAESARTLRIIEGTQARFDALSARLRDLSNWSGWVGNIQDAPAEPRFDVVCVFGVLEYAELYIRSEDGARTSFDVFIEKARSFLKPDGVLLLAIENRLGLKYWAGAAEDHSGGIFDGVIGYPTARSPKTFSRQSLKALFERWGFASIDEHYPFPDYKIPASVLTAELIDRFPELAASLAASRPYENYGAPRARLFPERLAVTALSPTGLLPEFANSFLWIASPTPESPARHQLLSAQLGKREIGWHYSMERREPVRTAFRLEEGGRLRVEKSLLTNGASAPVIRCDGFEISWLPTPSVAPEGTVLRDRLYRQAYFGEWTFFQDELRTFLARSLEKLSGLSFGATVDHAIAGRADCFGLEWKCEPTLPPSWFILRNVLALSEEGHELFPSSAPFGSFKALYEQLCSQLRVAPDLDRAVELEAAWRSAYSRKADPAAWRKELNAGLYRRFRASPFMRDPRLEARRKHLLRRVEAPYRWLKKQVRKAIRPNLPA